MRIVSFASKLRFSLMVLAGLLCWGTGLRAQTGTCNDGTTTNAQSKRGACSGHGGVKTWTGPTQSGQTQPVAPDPTAQPDRTATGARARTPAQPSPVTKASASTTSTAPVPGGGAGQVWVNLPTKIYHCAGTQWYGKTKSGKYMSEADAKAMGARPDHNKPCS